ncbi:hypothetical protein LC593_02000 [Nostoc sp. CHAB 5844]|nr:hypothetical protein [Nostoc sp. CHAB 5844]
MQDYDASQLSPEVRAFIEAIAQGNQVASLTQVIEQAVQSQIEHYLLEFQQAIASINATAIEVMQSELARIKHEGATVKGVLERLKAAATPDLPASDGDIATFRQAIENLEKYGSIIPSSTDILAAQLRLQKNHAWSLFWQSIVRLFIRRLEKIFNNENRTTA